MKQSRNSPPRHSQIQHQAWNAQVRRRGRRGAAAGRNCLYPRCEVLALVSRALGHSQDMLTGPGRSYRALHPRYFAAAVIRQATSRTLSEIGTVLGNRDHSTILHALRRIDHWTGLDPIHGKLLDLAVQVNDNFGLLKQREFRKMTISGIREGCAER